MPHDFSYAAHGKALMIALTGYGQEQDRDAAIQADFYHHLIKPASSEHLVTMLNKFASAR